jgi:hypothetical protein
MADLRGEFGVDHIGIRGDADSAVSEERVSRVNPGSEGSVVDKHMKWNVEDKAQWAILVVVAHDNAVSELRTP